MNRPTRHRRSRVRHRVGAAWTLAWLGVCAAATGPATVLAQMAPLPWRAGLDTPSGFSSLLRTDPAAQPLQQILAEVADRAPSPRLPADPTAAVRPPSQTAEAVSAARRSVPAESNARFTTPAAAQTPGQAASQTLIGPGHRLIELPDRIPAQCVKQAAERYQVPEMAMLAILRQESGGQTGVIGKNTDGSLDYGPAQFNSNSWARYMRDRYGISVAQLTNNMCQALMAQAYALRWEWNRCLKRGQTSIWCAVAYYHSPTKEKQAIYVRNVWRQHQRIIATGKF